MTIWMPVLFVCSLFLLERSLRKKVHNNVTSMYENAKSFHIHIFYACIAWAVIGVGSVLLTMTLVDPPNIVAGKIVAPLAFIVLITVMFNQLVFIVSLNSEKLIISSMLMQTKIYLGENLAGCEIKSYSGNGDSGSVVYRLDFGQKKKIKIVSSSLDDDQPFKKWVELHG